MAGRFNLQPSTERHKHTCPTSPKSKPKSKTSTPCARRARKWGSPCSRTPRRGGYYENKTKGDYVIQLKGPYDIALNKQPDGTFGITADLWNGHVENEVGPGYGKLLQFYGVHKATLEARKRGLSVLRRQQQNGSIKLVLMGV